MVQTQSTSVSSNVQRRRGDCRCTFLAGCLALSIGLSPLTSSPQFAIAQQPAEKTPAAEKAEPKKAEPKKAEPAKSDPKAKPDSKAKSDPKKPDAKGGPPAKADAKKGGAGKAAAVKTNDNPFAGFPASVELPDPKASPSEKPPRVALGKLNIDPAAICLIYLKGGEEAVRGRGGKGRFELEEIEASGQEASWRVSLVDGESTAIAQVVRQQNALSFQWLPAAAERDECKQLANCLLELSAGKGKLLLPLRRPTRGDPLTLSFDEPTIVARWEVATPPEPSRIKVELRMGAREPRYRFVGGSTISAARGSTWIEYMDKRSAEALKLKVECEYKNGVQLTVTPFFQIPGDTQVVRLSGSTYKKAKEQTELAVRQLTAQLAALPPASKKGGKGQSSPVAQLRGQIEKRLAAAQTAQTQLANIAEIRDAVDGKGKILVRATMEVEGQLVDLVLADKLK
ncbi:MAG: hypothetical protein U1A77_00305 [Pirellulales bacterium]